MAYNICFHPAIRHNLAKVFATILWGSFSLQCPVIYSALFLNLHKTHLECSYVLPTFCSRQYMYSSRGQNLSFLYFSLPSKHSPVASLTCFYQQFLQGNLGFAYHASQHSPSFYVLFNSLAITWIILPHF